MSVAEPGHVLVWVVVAGWFAGHGVGVVEDLLQVLDRSAFFDWRGGHCDVSCVIRVELSSKHRLGVDISSSGLMTMWSRYGPHIGFG